MKNRLTNISEEGLNKLKEENPQANIVSMPNKPLEEVIEEEIEKAIRVFGLYPKEARDEIGVIMRDSLTTIAKEAERREREKEEAVVDRFFETMPPHKVNNMTNTQQPEEWEKEFDERFGSLYGVNVFDGESGEMIMGNTKVKEFKSFIREILSQQKVGAFLLGYSKGNDIQIDWKYLEEDERKDLLSLLE